MSDSNPFAINPDHITNGLMSDVIIKTEEMSYVSPFHKLMMLL